MPMWIYRINWNWEKSRSEKVKSEVNQQPWSKENEWFKSGNSLNVKRESIVLGESDDGSTVAVGRREKQK